MTDEIATPSQARVRNDEDFVWSILRLRSAWLNYRDVGFLSAIGGLRNADLQTADGSIDISDLVFMVEYQFLDGPPPPECP